MISSRDQADLDWYPTIDDLRRFLTKIDISGGPDACWPWIACIGGAGYGHFGLNGKIERAPRVVMSWLGTRSLNGLMVCHRCDNKRCCNPTHLFLGTASDNMRDMHAKGRNFQKTRPECIVRGEQHARWKRPLPQMFGDTNPARLYPERLRRGENHPFRINPALHASGDRNGARLYPERLARGSSSPSSKLCEADIPKIMAMHAANMSNIAIGAQFGVSNVAISCIVRGKTWKHVKREGV